MQISAHGRNFASGAKAAVVMAVLAWTTSLPGAEKTFSFRTSILPLLTKAGCNGGACHGAATGQGGFKLSLLGYDPEEDYERITRELGGRRIERSAPSESLLLRKPSSQIEHEGGRRLPRQSVGYEAIRRWIEAGAPFGLRDLRVVSIAVWPETSFLKTTNEEVNLRVEAALSDGSRQDVTALALYSSNDDAIAEVEKQGNVRVVGRGVTSIMVRYSGQVAAARIVLPFAAPEVAAVAEAAPDEHWIDRQIGAELKRLGLPRSGLSSDSEFLRRVTLDLIGRLPTADEARTFLRRPSSSGDRRQVIDALMQREEFVDFWTMWLGDLFLISGRRGNKAATGAYHEWVRTQVARNTPFNEIARTLLTSRGDITTNGPANFFTLATDPRDMAEHASRIFLGTQIACARCHAHPADRWTQEDYYGFAAYFARVNHEGNLISVSDRGEVDHPKTAALVSPRSLGGTSRQIASGTDRRSDLADWMTSRDTAQFARALVNRVWKRLLGRGLVEPVDDLRPTNPATYPALLEALAADFVAHRHDLRHLIRMIASTRTYQLASKPIGINGLDDRFYSHAYLKELPAAVYLDAVADVTGVPEAFPEYPEGTRAVELIGAGTPSYALDVLGRCLRDTACEGGGRRGGGLAQALHLINGPTINAKLGGERVNQLAGLNAREIIEDLYIRAFARPADPKEVAEWEPLIASARNKTEAVQDMLWTLLNSREFVFNH